MLERARQPQTAKVTKDVVEQEKRSHDKGNDSPPPEEERDKRQLPEVLVDARLAQVSANALLKSHQQRADILVELDVLGGRDVAAPLTVSACGHGWFSSKSSEQV
jgi:hypothetical protein